MQHDMWFVSWLLVEQVTVSTLDISKWVRYMWTQKLNRKMCMFSIDKIGLIDICANNPSDIEQSNKWNKIDNTK